MRDNSRIVAAGLDVWGIEGAVWREMTSHGVTLFLLTPLDVDGVQGDHAEAEDRIDAAAGLLAAFGRRNLVYRRLFENTTRADGKDAKVHSVTLINPASLPAPDVSTNALLGYTEAAARITALDGAESERLSLALRWFGFGVYETGVDAFLRSWIAIETASPMTASTIRPLLRSLATAYEISVEELQRKYQIGRLHGLRNRIVHQGHRPPIDASLLDYMEGVFLDVLLVAVGLPVERRVDRLLERSDFDLSVYLGTG